MVIIMESIKTLPENVLTALTIVVLLMIGLISTGLISSVYSVVMGEKVLVVKNDSSETVKDVVVDFWYPVDRPVRITGVYLDGKPVDYAYNLYDADRVYRQVAGGMYAGSVMIKYTGSEPSGEWYALDYDDSGWESGWTPLDIDYNETWVRAVFTSPGNETIINGVKYVVKHAFLLVLRHGQPITVYFNGQLLDNITAQEQIALDDIKYIVIGKFIYWKEITDMIRYGGLNILAYYINLTQINGLGYTDPLIDLMGELNYAVIYVYEPVYDTKYHIYIYIDSIEPHSVHEIHVSVEPADSVVSENNIFNIKSYTLYDRFTAKEHFNYSFDPAVTFEIYNDDFVYNPNMWDRGDLPVIFNWTLDMSVNGLVVEAFYLPLCSDMWFDFTIRLGHYDSYDSIPELDGDIGDVRELNEHVYNSYDYNGEGFILVFSNTSSVSIANQYGQYFSLFPAKIKYFNRLNYEALEAWVVDGYHDKWDATGESYGNLVNTLVLNAKGHMLIDYVLVYPYNEHVYATKEYSQHTPISGIVSALGSIGVGLTNVLFAVMIVITLLTVVEHLREKIKK